MCGETQHDEPYAVALLAKTLADHDGIVEGYSCWTFTDLFEEFSQLPGAFHGGFGLQTFDGIAKPTYQVFELFHRLGDVRLPVMAGTEPSSVEVLATRIQDGLRMIVHNHQIPGEPVEAESILVREKAVPQKAGEESSPTFSACFFCFLPSA